MRVARFSAGRKRASSAKGPVPAVLFATLDCAVQPTKLIDHNLACKVLKGCFSQTRSCHSTFPIQRDLDLKNTTPNFAFASVLFTSYIRASHSISQAAQTIFGSTNSFSRQTPVKNIFEIWHAYFGQPTQLGLGADHVL